MKSTCFPFASGTWQSSITRLSCGEHRIVSSRRMYAVELDRSKRLLVISALQRVTAEEAKLASRRVRELVRDIDPGFRVLADFRWLDSMDSAAARHVSEIMDALAEKGVAS